MRPFCYLGNRRLEIALDQIRKSHARLTQAAAEVDLRYDFEKAVVANSFDAHRLAQLAKIKGRGDAMEERLFKAYFSDGGNLGETPVSSLGTRHCKGR